MISQLGEPNSIPVAAPGTGVQDRFSAADARPGRPAQGRQQDRFSATDARPGRPAQGRQLDRFSAADARPGRPAQGRSKTDSARPMPGWGRQGYERKTDSARRARIGPDHTGLVVCVGSCRLYPDARTRLPATPAHFIGCFFCAPCSKAEPRPCMAFSGVSSQRPALRFPARERRLRGHLRAFPGPSRQARFFR